MGNRFALALRAALLASIAAFAASAAGAQTGATNAAAVDEPDRAPARMGSENGVIIVTASRRGETFIEAPVQILTVPSNRLEKQAINSDTLARFVRTLITGEATSRPQDGIVSSGGLSRVDAMQCAAQAVSSHVDGMATSTRKLVDGSARIPPINSNSRYSLWGGGLVLAFKNLPAQTVRKIPSL